MHRGGGRVVPTWPQKVRISPATIPPIFPPYLQPESKTSKNLNQSGGRGAMGQICEIGEERLPRLPPKLLLATVGGAIPGVLLWQPPIRTSPPIIFPRKTHILPGTRLVAVRENPGSGPIFKNSVVQMLPYYPVRSDPKKKR